ncbi:MAG: hypothetical protein KDA92_09155 [Planctomycetales bacterium]|nr:hypothetical protein [Planctomycetales bacterium]
MRRIDSDFQRATLDAQLGTLLVLLSLCLGTGCSAFQTVVGQATHWQENRADCPPFPDNDGNNDCVKPCVALEPVAGYLSSGPTFGGEQIIGEPSRTAVDRMMEMKDELETLRAEKSDLQQQLSLAEETIREQGVSIDAASQELQRALADFNMVRERLNQWEHDTRQLHERLRNRDGDREQLLSRFEADLQEILSACETQAATAPSPSLPKLTPSSAPAKTPAEDDEAQLPTSRQEAATGLSNTAPPVAGANEELPVPPLEERPVLQSPVFGNDGEAAAQANDGDRGGAVMWMFQDDRDHNSEKLAPVVQHIDDQAVSLIPPRNQEVKSNETSEPR